MKKTCVQCGKEFEMSEAEVAYYEEKDLEVPKRCKACKKANRIRGNEVNTRTRQRKSVKFLSSGKPLVISIGAIIVAIAIIFGGKLRGDEKTNNSSTYQNIGISQDQIDDVITFGSVDLLMQHYNKHGIDMGFKDENEYLTAANSVINNKKSLHKHEKEDGDDVYYLEETNDLVIVSKKGNIRTYFRPDDGIKYYNRQ